jgi:hypothetical protein
MSQTAVAVASTSTPAPATPALPPAFWYLIGGGVLVAAGLLAMAARNFWAMRQGSGN